MVSNPIICCSVTHWISTMRGIKCPQHKKTAGAFRPLERGLYGVGAFFAALRERGLVGLCRRNGRQSWRWLRALSKTSLAGGTAWDTLIEIKGHKEIPT